MVLLVLSFVDLQRNPCIREELLIHIVETKMFLKLKGFFYLSHLKCDVAPDMSSCPLWSKFVCLTTSPGICTSICAVESVVEAVNFCISVYFAWLEHRL